MGDSPWKKLTSYQKRGVVDMREVNDLAKKRWGTGTLPGREDVIWSREAPTAVERIKSLTGAGATEDEVNKMLPTIPEAYLERLMQIPRRFVEEADDGSGLDIEQVETLLKYHGK